MAFPVVYGKSKLASATSGGAILDSGDLNYSVETIALTEESGIVSLSAVRASLYVVSSATLGFAGQVHIPREWEENNDQQHDGRGTGWRIRILNDSSSASGDFIQVNSELQGVFLTHIEDGTMMEFIFFSGLGRSRLLSPTGLSYTLFSENYLLYNPVSATE